MVLLPLKPLNQCRNCYTILTLGWPTILWQLIQASAFTCSSHPIFTIELDLMNAALVSFGNKPLSNVTSLSILGVGFCNLSWMTHSDLVQQKMNSMIGVLKHCGHTKSTDVRLQIYTSFIALCLDYFLLVWGHLLKSLGKALGHSLTRMLQYVLRNVSVSFEKITCSVLGFQRFGHLVAKRCSAQIFEAIRNDTLSSLLNINDNTA